MKKLKNLLALLLVAALCLMLLAACAASKPEGSGDTPAAPAADPSPEDGETAENAEPAPAQPDEPEDADEVEDEDITSIVFAYRYANTPEESGVQAVEDAINAIIEPKIGVHVDLQPFDAGSYQTQIPLMIAGGETLDLCAFYGAGTAYTTMKANGQILNIKPYLDEYGDGLKEVLGEYINTFATGDECYAIPTWRNYSTNMYIIANREPLEELGLLDAFDNVSDWDEYETLMEQIRDNTAMAPIGGQYQIMWMPSACVAWNSADFEFTAYDPLGDPNNLLRVGEDGKVASIYDFEDTVYMMKKSAEWYEEGLAYADAAYTQELNANLLKSEAIFSLVIQSELGVENNWANRVGFPVACKKISDKTKVISTMMLSVGSLGVPVVAEEPEAAVKFLNELYTNREIMNLITWGIEGVDYVVNEAGEAAFPNGDSNVPYHSADFLFGNFFLDLPWEGNGGDYREVCYDLMMDATASPTLGYIVDTSDLTSYVSGITSVYNEYSNTLCSGLYTDELFDEMMHAMEDAGLRDYIDAVQMQLDAWEAAK